MLFWLTSLPSAFLFLPLLSRRFRCTREASARFSQRGSRIYHCASAKYWLGMEALFFYLHSVSEQDARYPISDIQANASMCLSDWRPVDRSPGYCLGSAGQLCLHATERNSVKMQLWGEFILYFGKPWHYNYRQSAWVFVCCGLLHDESFGKQATERRVITIIKNIIQRLRNLGKERKQEKPSQRLLQVNPSKYSYCIQQTDTVAVYSGTISTQDICVYRHWFIIRAKLAHAYHSITIARCAIA